MKVAQWPPEMLREAGQAELWVGPVPRAKWAGDDLLAFPGDISLWLECTLSRSLHLSSGETSSFLRRAQDHDLQPVQGYRTWWQGEGAMF